MLGNLYDRIAKRGKRDSAPESAHLGVFVPGGTTLRVLVVEVVDGRSKVWGWAERRWPGAEADKQGRVEICQDLLAEAEDMALTRADRRLMPDKMLVGVPASQLWGRSWSLEHGRSRPERPIDERELKALLGRALRLVVNRLWDTLPGDRQQSEEDWVLLESVPVALTIDGRGVTDPVGFRAQVMGATVFASLCRVDWVVAWQAVARQLEFSTLWLKPMPLALACAAHSSQGLMIDVGGAATDLTWWRNGRPLAVGSFPLGGESLSQALALKWRLTSDQAERLKRAYAKGRLDEQGRAQVQEVVYPVLRAWFDDIEATLVRLEEVGGESLPSKIYLLGGSSVLPEIVQSLGALAWSERLQFARYPEVQAMRPTDVPGVMNLTDRGKGAGDVPALALAALAGPQVRRADRPARLLTELCSE